jgi:hypothetical protein
VVGERQALDLACSTGLKKVVDGGEALGEERDRSTSPPRTLSSRPQASWRLTCSLLHFFLDVPLAFAMPPG